MPKKGYVYLIWAQGTDRYKIGRTTGNPYTRVMELQGGSPYKLELYGVIWTEDILAKEKEIQERLRSCRLDGEWFQLSPLLFQAVMYFFDRRPLQELAKTARRRRGISRTKRRILGWNEISHGHPWHECWEQHSIFLETSHADDTGWIEEYRFSWVTSEGVAFYGQYDFCCTAIAKDGSEQELTRLIGCYRSEITSKDERRNMRTTQTKLRRASEKILSGEPYANTLKYLGGGLLLKNLQ